MTGPLGSLVVLTDRMAAAEAGQDLATTVGAAARAGTDAVVLREKDLAPAARTRLGRVVADALAGTLARLVVASDVELAVELGAVAVHLAQADPPVGPERRRGAAAGLLVGRSCHDRGEVAAATREGVDYLLVSPVFATRSKPGHGPPLGPAGAAGLADADHPAPPTYGLGGIDEHNAGACLAAGLCGVAVMGAVMDSPQPRARVHALRASLGSPSVTAR